MKMIRRSCIKALDERNKNEAYRDAQSTFWQNMSNEEIHNFATFEVCSNNSHKKRAAQYTHIQPSPRSFLESDDTTLADDAFVCWCETRKMYV